VDYSFIKPGKGPRGGIMKTPAPGCPTGWQAYVTVVDIAATLTKVEKFWGSVCVPKSEIPGVGYLAVFTDPAGGVLALFQDLEGGGEG
jgi:predicted enzyme related to lactoylglutathione lyase